MPDLLNAMLAAQDIARSLGPGWRADATKQHGSTTASLVREDGAILTVRHREDPPASLHIEACCPALSRTFSVDLLAASDPHDIAALVHASILKPFDQLYPLEAAHRDAAQARGAAHESWIASLRAAGHRITGEHRDDPGRILLPGNAMIELADAGGRDAVETLTLHAIPREHATKIIALLAVPPNTGEPPADGRPANSLR